MKLTDKCKEDFEKWFMTDYILRTENIGKNVYGLKMLERCIPTLRYGIYVDFFDSVGILINVIPPMKNHNADYHFYVDDEINECFGLNTRHKARIKAI